MLSSDLLVYKSKANGRMDGGQRVTSGEVQNVFKHVTSSQRLNGLIDYVGTHWKVADAAGGTLLDPEIYIDAPTPSATDYILMFEMGSRERVEDIIGYVTGNDTRRKYGPAYLKEDVAIGDSVCVVTVKNAAMASGPDIIIADGDFFKITDKATADALIGNEEPFEVASFVVVGNDIQITRVGTFQHAYIAAVTPTPTSPRVSALIKPGDISASVTVPLNTSAGEVNFADHPIRLDGIGTVDEDWTIYNDDATHLTVTGDSLGVVATGLTTADLDPVNGDFARIYFGIDFEAWVGARLAGDTLTFTTHAAAVKIGQKRVVPPGSPSLANNKTTQVLGGEVA